MEVSIPIMPVGVYRKKNKKGNFMYFRNGKLISKKSYDMSKKGRSLSRNRMTRSKRPQGRKMAKRQSIPHPSVTGMASGLAIASYLNAGTTSKASLFAKTVMGDSVVQDIMDGQLSKAGMTLANNAIDMIGSEGGRKTLVGAAGVAAIGALARKQLPNLKLGGTKLYFRL